MISRRSEPRHLWTRKGPSGRPRKYDEPKIGERYGVWKVVALLGRGHRGRSDLRIEIQCVCGRRAETYEFNLRARRASTCKHGSAR